MSYRVLSFPGASACAAHSAPRALPLTKIAASKLHQAAELTESTAFELAGTQPSSIISQLIMLSADLTRLAQTVEKSDRD